jgi:hypothetical protein
MKVQHKGHIFLGKKGQTLCGASPDSTFIKFRIYKDSCPACSEIARKLFSQEISVSDVLIALQSEESVL